MKVFFRVDASLEIGTGHLARCLTLASEICNSGNEVSFVSRSHYGGMEKKISELGYEVAFMERPEARFATNDRVTHAGWLGVEWEQDAEETQRIIDAGKKTDWLIVDHYALDSRWHKKLRSSVKKILVIDDLADRTLDCDILLDQTFNRDISAYQNLIPNNCMALLGSQYALLRPEFGDVRNRAMISRTQTSAIRQVMVSMGGIDAGNYTQQVLEALEQVPLDVLGEPFNGVFSPSGTPALSTPIA